MPNQAESEKADVQEAAKVSIPYRRVLESENSDIHKIDLKEIVPTIRRKSKYIIPFTLFCTIITAIITFNLDPKYVAYSAVTIDGSESRVVDIQSVTAGNPQDDAFLQTQVSILESSVDHARRIVESLDLLKYPEFNVSMEEETDIAFSLEDIHAWIENFWPVEAGIAEQQQELPATGSNEARKGPLLPGLAAGPSDPEQHEVYSHDDLMEIAAQILLDNLRITQEENSYVIAIGFTSGDPILAADIPNMMADVFIEGRLATKQNATVKAADWLSKRVDELRGKLLESEAAVELYRAENGLPAGRQQGIELDAAELSSLNQRLLELEGRQLEAETTINLITDIRNRGEALETVAEITSSPQISDLRREEGELLRLEAQLSKEYGSRHPRIIELEADMEKLTDKVAREIENIVRGLEHGVAVTIEQQEALKNRIKEAEGRLNLMNQAETKLTVLEREVEANRSLYQTFLGRFKELTGQDELLEADVSVISRAYPPNNPVFPQPFLFIAAGFVTSFAVSTLIAFLYESMDGTIRNGRQLERLIGVPHFGDVPKIKGLKRKMKLQDYQLAKPRSAYSESINNMQVMLHFSNSQVVLVTSCLPNEGKTSTALALGTAAGRAGIKSVLVSLDLRNLSIMEEFTNPLPPKGIEDFLEENAGIMEIIHTEQRTQNFDAIFAKRQPEHPLLLLASDRLDTLLDQLRWHYEFIILDAPPVLGLTDIKMIASRADCALFVVQWGETSEDAVVNGFEILQNTGLPITGTVLNQIDFDRQVQFKYGDASQYYNKYKRYYQD